MLFKSIRKTKTKLQSGFILLLCHNSSIFYDKLMRKLRSADYQTDDKVAAHRKVMKFCVELELTTTETHKIVR